MSVPGQWTWAGDSFMLVPWHVEPEWERIWVRAVVVAQLVERLLPVPEVRGSNPVIGKNLLNIYFLSTVLKRRK